MSPSFLSSLMNFSVKNRTSGRSIYPSSHMIENRNAVEYEVNEYIMPNNAGHRHFLSFA